MPRLNTRDRETPGTFHVYNQTPDRRPAFVDDADRDVFLDILKRHLGKSSVGGRADRKCRSIEGVELLGFNLMTTHFHLILWQKQRFAIARLMNVVLARYVRYFNRRHGKSGPMFRGEYRAKRIRNKKQFRWTVVYVLDNHPDGVDYRYSSHRYFAAVDDSPSWLNASATLTGVGGIDAYLELLELRENRAQINAELFG